MLLKAIWRIKKRYLVLALMTCMSPFPGRPLLGQALLSLFPLADQAAMSFPLHAVAVKMSIWKTLYVLHGCWLASETVW